jgi:hypothetical protein
MKGGKRKMINRKKWIFLENYGYVIKTAHGALIVAEGNKPVRESAFQVYSDMWSTINVLYRNNGETATSAGLSSYDGELCFRGQPTKLLKYEKLISQAPGLPRRFRQRAGNLLKIIEEKF